MIGKLCSILLFSAVCSSWVHGTAIVAAINQKGLVMAGDGLAVWTERTENPQTPFRRRIELNEQKVSICGKRFVCAAAGINHIHADQLDVHYDFEKWIVTVKAETSIMEFARAVGASLTADVHLDRILQSDHFWESQTARGVALVAYQIIGYERNIPHVCTLALELDRARKRLQYVEPRCMRILLPARECCYMPEGVQRKDIDEALNHGTPQAIKQSELKKDAILAVNREKRLHKYSRPIQELVATSLSFVEVEGEFNCSSAGGETTVGLIVKGKRPIVAKFPARRSSACPTVAVAHDHSWR